MEKEEIKYFQENTNEALKEMYTSKNVKIIIETVVLDKETTEVKGEEFDRVIGFDLSTNESGEFTTDRYSIEDVTRLMRKYGLKEINTGGVIMSINSSGARDYPELEIKSNEKDVILIRGVVRSKVPNTAICLEKGKIESLLKNNNKEEIIKDTSKAGSNVVYISGIMVDKVKESYKGRDFVRVVGIGFADNTEGNNQYLGLNLDEAAEFMVKNKLKDVSTNGVSIRCNDTNELGNVISVKIDKCAVVEMLCPVKDDFVFKGVIDVMIDGGIKGNLFITGGYASYDNSAGFHNTLRKYPSLSKSCNTVMSLDLLDKYPDEFKEIFGILEADLKDELPTSLAIVVSNVISRYIDNVPEEVCISSKNKDKVNKVSGKSDSSLN